MSGGHSHSEDFQRLIERRRKFIEGEDANRGEINLDIFEDFYPDRAHFVYELLKNAEYAGASEAALSSNAAYVTPKRIGGREYFEVVEFLPELRKRHPQNYIALCPNHSAMYRMVNGSRETMREAFLAVSGNELAVVLAGRDMTIYFSKTHIIELRAVLDVEESLPPEAKAEAADGGSDAKGSGASFATGSGS
jgi:hypothetical protein